MPIPQLSPKSRRGWQASKGRRHYTSQKGKVRGGGKLLKTLWLLAAGGIIFIVGVVVVISDDIPDPKKIIERRVSENTTIYDRTGEHILFQIYSDVKRTRLELSNIPIHVQQATLVAEDRDFYQHKGFKLTSFIRAAIFNIINLDPKSQGGSTITQQFVKNAILTPEKTYIRKLKELVLAYRIEKNFSKEEILTLYFNEIPYGSTAYGIEAASQTYFGKNTQELTIAEGALLAALPKAPTYYSPYGNHKDQLINRQHHILNAMVDEGYLTEEETEIAKNYELNFKPPRENIIAPHFVFYLKEGLAAQYGERVLEQGGLKIWSTLDLEKQRLAEETIAEFAEKNSKNFNANNAALVSIDPSTGQILAMVGSKDYFDTENDGNVNVATRPRQPGSSFKPIVYAAAFTKGYTPETKLFDVETIFKTEMEDYSPKNYDEEERGLVSLRQALAGSLNIPSVKLLYLTGIDNVLTLAKSLGYSTLQDRSRFGLSLVLGGAEVKLLEHVAAFGALAQEGRWHPPVGILKIEGEGGRIIEEYKERDKKIIDTNVSRQITNILSDNEARAFVFGINNHLTLSDRPVAAKTGTTNNFADAWTVGYTPSLVTGVWVGNNDNSPMLKGAAGGQVAAPIWQQFIQQAVKDTPPENFTPPQTKPVENPILRGELIGETRVEIDRISGKLATQYTPPDLKLIKTYFSAHSILYYINKDNPNGQQPINPEIDIQFINWESGVGEWATKNDFLLESPPTEYDDVHLPEFFPKISIISPQKNQEVTSENLLVKIKTESTKGISFVDYSIDGRPVARINLYPFELELIMTDFSNGWHTLTAEVNDPVGNRSEEKITFSLNIHRVKPGLLWINPPNQMVVSLDEFPITIKIKSPTPELINYITIIAKNLITDQEIELANNLLLDNLQEKSIGWSSDNINPGSWQLTAKITDNNGGSTIKNGPTLLINPAQTTNED